MKKFFITIVSLTFLFAIGCQETSITDPASVESLNKEEESSTRSGNIPLERMLSDPYPVMNSFIIINGDIEYAYTLNAVNTLPPVQQYLLSVQLNITAGLTYLCTVCDDDDFESPAGHISNESTDTFTLLENGRYLLEKTYTIQGRSDGMVLICKFIITTEDITLSEIYLVLPNPENG